MSSGKFKQLSIAQALRGTLANQELSVHYQGKQLLKSGKVVGAEVLLRWQHSELGSVSPVEFVPVAERSGIICEIGEWVLEESIKTCKGWC
ncbi:MAG: EAL domain-containing protein (putative c-di-GMP-specific phosphodiesterase class I) [Glaciecola sp.]|jgi:EAL domain-containing protein (putative c-di-GMP-specific phosphodiesterase class I)